MNATNSQDAVKMSGIEGGESNALFGKQDYLILGAAGISFVFSVLLWFSEQRDAGLFVGLWVPSIIGLGVYIKTSTRRPQL